MAIKKPVEIEEELDLDEQEPALKLDTLTVAVPQKAEKDEGPMVPIYLPKLEDSGSEGLKVDQYEHVTIANETGEQNWRVLRGVRVEVPVSVFMVLKARYPEI